MCFFSFRAFSYLRRSDLPLKEDEAARKTYLQACTPRDAVRENAAATMGERDLQWNRTQVSHYMRGGGGNATSPTCHRARHTLHADGTHLVPPMTFSFQ